MNTKKLIDLLEADKDDCSNYKISLWEPYSQKEYDMIFTGVNHSNKTINFNIKQIPASKAQEARLERQNKLLLLYRDAAIIKKEIDKLEEHYIDCYE